MVKASAAKRHRAITTPENVRILFLHGLKKPLRGMESRARNEADVRRIFFNGGKPLKRAAVTKLIGGRTIQL